MLAVKVTTPQINVQLKPEIEKDYKIESVKDLNSRLGIKREGFLMKIF